MVRNRESTRREEESDFYTQIYKDFGVSEEDEKAYFENKDEEYCPAVELSLKRSFENVRAQLSWMLYRTDRKQKMLKQIKRELGKIGTNLSFGYCADIGIALHIVSSDRIMTGQDILEESVKHNGPSGLAFKGRTAFDYNEQRAGVEQELGWNQNEILTMGVDDSDDLGVNGSSSCWGPVRFEFDHEKLADKCTYTLGDSMSSSRGHAEMGEPEKRQIAFIHLALAKSIHNVLEQRQYKKRSGDKYVETQVPKEEAKNNGNLKKITIDKRRFYDEIKQAEETRFNGMVYKEEYGYEADELEWSYHRGGLVKKSEIENPKASVVVQKKELTETQKKKIWDRIIEGYVKPLVDYAKKKGIKVEFV